MTKEQKTIVELQEIVKKNALKGLPPRNKSLDMSEKDQKRWWKVLNALGKALTSAWAKRRN